MQAPSPTARYVALLRAAHQLLEGGAIFSDPYAIPISGESAETIALHGRPEIRLMRLFMAARSRFAEDSLATAVDRGVRQAVVLGAGLDTFGLRNPHARKGLRVFEADRPAAQQWKRACLAKANLPIPEGLIFAAVDFEREALLDSLIAAGFKPEQPTFVIWLGVVPYLSHAAVLATLSALGRLPDVEIVFDYGEPLEAYPPEHRTGYEAMIARAAAGGEPWLTFFKPAQLQDELSQLGFSDVEDLSPREIAIRYAFERDPNAPGGHIVRARCAAGD